VELTVSDLDETLVPQYVVLGKAYAVLSELREGPLDDALGELGVGRRDLARLTQRYLACPDIPAGTADLCILAFLLARSGSSSGLDRARFEAALASELGGQTSGFFAPFWVPSVAGLRQRRLFFPLVAPRRSSVVQAYEGLVHHVRGLFISNAVGELSFTAILWRVAALIDGLEPGNQSLYDKMNAVRGRVVQSSTISLIERQLWTPLTKQFSDRRHALSHLVVRDGHSFESSVEYALHSRDELVAASTALGLAVLQEVADDLSDMAAPNDEWSRVWSYQGTGWIDDQIRVDRSGQSHG
jgi:hypothetical protein